MGDDDHLTSSGLFGTSFHKNNFFFYMNHYYLVQLLRAKIYLLFDKGVKSLTRSRVSLRYFVKLILLFIEGVGPDSVDWSRLGRVQWMDDVRAARAGTPTW